MNDLPTKLRIKSSMINMGEMITWGSETALMDQAAAEIERLAEDNDRLAGYLKEMIYCYEHDFGEKVHHRPDWVKDILSR